jgi:transposase InsO family protein
MPVAEGGALDALLPALAGKHGRSAPDALAGRAVSQDPVLRLPADGGGHAAGRFGGESQAGEAFDARDGQGWPRFQRRSRWNARRGIEAIYQKPNTSLGHPAHKVYPYLLRGLVIDRPNQVWCADITYVPMAKGFVYLVAVMDWFSRRVLSWRVSISMDSDFCVEALREAMEKHGQPEIFNTDQGVQFTSGEFLAGLQAQAVRISMDGKGRYLDNIFIERLWRSLKYEEIVCCERVVSV